MALEIERRFLVNGNAWRREVCGEQQLQQGYLTSRADGVTLRVRISQSPGAQASACLTLKAPLPAAAARAAPTLLEGLVRQEFEYAIPLADARALLALTTHQLCKCRYNLALEGADWVVDVFEGANAPLVIAEVEMDRVDQPIGLPPWCAQELTGRHELSNAALAWTPFGSWSAEMREPLLRMLSPAAES